MRPRSSIGAISCALLAVTLVVAAPVAQAAKPRGAASPQEAVAALKKATAANDFLGALPLFSADTLKGVADEGVTGALMVLALSDPDDGMPGAAKPSKAQLDAQRKKYKDAVDIIKGVLQPYGLDTLIGKPPLSPDAQKTIGAALAKADNVALITSLFTTLETAGPMLGMKEKAKPQPVLTVGTVTGYKITGDTASAMDGTTPVAFVKVDGRWYISAPSSSNSAGAVSGSSSSTPAARQAPAAKTVASGNQPEVVLGGIQIAKVVVADDDFSAKPFHSDNGTKLALWIKMPANQGLIELDEDASLLQHFGDDKGADFGGKFGSFPEEFKDGTGGVIEIESSAVPGAGATAVLADGSLSMTVATGTRKTRVANVKLQNDYKFSLGATAIVVSDVATDGDDQTFTLKLARQAMTGIKNVVFLDPRGQAIDGHRTSTGYMNDAGEMEFSVKTAAKTVTLEFEAWQGLRVIKVPFKIKGGIGLN